MIAVCLRGSHAHNHLRRSSKLAVIIIIHQHDKSSVRRNMKSRDSETSLTWLTAGGERLREMLNLCALLLKMTESSPQSQVGYFYSPDL